MAKIRISFYKGVPFDMRNENVLLGDSSYSGNTLDDFLEQYEIDSSPVDVDMFDIQGTEENGFVDVDLSFEPYNVNYMKVLQFLDNNTILTKYYFVDNYTMQARMTFRLFVHVDIWQTYARQYSTSVTNALVAQATSFSLPYGIKEKMTPTTSKTNYINRTVLVNQLYRLVVHFSSNLKGELAVVSKEEFSIGNAYAKGLVISRLENVKFYGGEIEQPFNSFDVFVVPTQFIGDLSYLTLSELYFTSKNEVVKSPNFYIIDKIDKTPVVHTNEFDFSVKPEESKITWISTGNVSVELPFNNLTYRGTVSVSIKNDIGMELYINNQFFNILDDFRINSSVSEFSSWYAQNRNAESARKTNETLGLIGSGLGIVGSVVSGNVLGTLGAGLNLVQTIQGQRTNDAIIQDRQNSPTKLISDTNQILSFNKTYGLSLFSITPDNHYEMKKYNQYYGFIGNQLYLSVPYKVLNYDERFRYYRCETMEIQGEFSMSIKNRIKELFQNGIRVWNYGKHYLDSFENKLTQEEIDKLGE